MKRSPSRDVLVAQASNANPARTVWGDWPPWLVIPTSTTGKMPVGPTAKMAVLRSLRS